MYRDFLINKIEPYRKLGYKKLESGVELYGLDTNIAPQAWLHLLFSALDEKGINEIELLIGRRIPISLAEFYNEMNGLNVFLDTLSLYGLRKDSSRSIETMWQPFSIQTPNVQERVADADDAYIFFGFYSETGNRLYMDARNECVYLCQYKTAAPLKMWKSMFIFFESELNRIFVENNPKYFN